MTIVAGSHPEVKTRPVICFFPGGPGLSSRTLRNMDILARSFDLAYFDTPGTGGLPEVTSVTFDEIVEALEREVLALGRPVVLVGHSFGGLYSVALAHRRRLSCKGVVLVGTPLTPRAMEIVGENNVKYGTPELFSTFAEFTQAPTNETLRRFILNYGVLFFHPKTIVAGSAMIRADQISCGTFTSIDTPGVIAALQSIEKLKALTIPKILLFGSDDVLIGPDSPSRDGGQCGLELVEVQDAGHFMPFEQPKQVAQVIEGTVWSA